MDNDQLLSDWILLSKTLIKQVINIRFFFINSVGYPLKNN
ncbi:hypothetical protein HDF26_003916 [Pedobacter cryoconitis]|uniref:Uncharacterized protein n=1 Tax=Pedobacter cryoconitis TaxID=188932 RepID=A0A7W8ZKT3_9SPHI|nr:hypothetical protein [Pedobacter cryoconitis]MBB6273456.1 hypothetical protein [Pedobacter cryoconitis]